MDKDIAESITHVYGTAIAHRLIMQFLFAKMAETKPDPAGFVREIIATTITSMAEMTQGGKSEFQPLLSSAAAELELIGTNLELRLRNLSGRSPQEEQYPPSSRPR